MRTIIACVAIGACLTMASGCSRAVKPPAGRWEGTYDAADVSVGVRLEIDRTGNVFLSAPDAIDFPQVSADVRNAMHERLAERLAEDWGDVQARRFDFDGRVFRKPGGFAPQMEWDAATRHMAVIVYIERRPGLRIPLRTVEDFSANPWS